MSLRQTVSLIFNITGNGVLIPTEEKVPPALLRLYMQRKGDDMSAVGPMQQYRYWSLPVALTGPGDGNLNAILDGANWTDVYGAKGSDFPDRFAQCVANADVVGFTFGGAGAGHGVFVKPGTGTSHFTLTSYTVN